MTASSNFEHEHERALDAGCDDFVYKPVPASMVFDKLAAHLGVRYHYREPVTTPAEATTYPSVDTLQAMLSDMPLAWIADLQQAALSADADWITTLCTHIAAEHAALRQMLQQYVQHFRFDTIQEITQQVIDEPRDTTR
ncbi:MAG: hypothetical protein ETSY1_08605 [Candidatus Entotheonella factor]|uniref:Response regulatory domain-containing protein n=1 Tax=Entotheonella factor TaxID=1429438 RepID=W4LSU7_ENTF1|nr:MAG: hypothetical protein ETSY1_08605 [Candidatus Entotheonella factor]